jgi:hypothetical protein
MREYTLANEPGDAAEENPGSDEESEALRTGRLGFSGGGFGHERSQTKCFLRGRKPDGTSESRHPNRR